MKLHFDSTCGRLLATSAALLFGAAASAAEAPPPAPVPTAVVPVDEADSNDEVTGELIELLSSRGLLSKDDAEHLIAKLRAQAAKRVAARNAAAAGTAAAQGPATPSAGTPEAAVADAAKKPPVRVIYLPEIEKKRIREEVKQEVIEQAKAENWAQPNALPEWTRRFAFSGEFRFRYERDFYDSNNSPFFINFNAINTGSPYDVSQNNLSLPPLLNTTQDRALPRISARLKIDAKVSDDFRAEFRVVSGNTTNPVSTNQTLGTDFNKFNVVIDRANLAYQPDPDLSVRLGRVGNPWISTPLTWYSELSFDGLTAQYHRTFGAWTPFATAGAYSVENTTFDFPSTQAAKVASRDKWLYAAQVGTQFAFNGGDTATLAAALYDFDHLQGELSSPCTPLSAADLCDSDITRPGFLQKGNTLFAIRNLAANPANPTGPQFQYFGLASAFREANLLARGDFVLDGPLHLIVDADFVRNLAYRRSRAAALVPVNNYTPGGVYGGGGNGYYTQILVGRPRLEHRYDWNVAAGYRRVESDAVVDAFNDPDFYIGGTNAKGYHLIGSLGVGDNVWLQARWFSGTEVSGAPLAIDVLQLDLNARF